jgi:hypothetical protein
MSDAVIVSIIGGGFSVVVTLIEVMRRQNNKDHGRNTDRLDDILINLQRVEKKADRYGKAFRVHMNTDHKKPTRKPTK